MRIYERTHCKRGHPLRGPEADVRLVTKGTRWQFRVCRRCADANRRAWISRKRREG